MARRLLFAAASVALTFLAQVVLAAPVAPATPPAPQPPGAQAGLPGVTIEATQERQAVRRRVEKFVASVIVRPTDETLMRWDTPVCPLVAGLPRAMGEFVLTNISQAAVKARAPLGGTTCRPNLYVVASAVPEQLLKEWWRREPWMYDTRRGIRPVMTFIESKRPVRACIGCTR